MNQCVFTRIVGAFFLSAALVAPLGFSARAAEQPTTSPSGRSREAIVKDLQGVQQELQAAIGSPDQLFDAKKRAELGPKALPIMKRMLALIDELSAVQPVPKNSRMSFASLLVLLDDPQATAELNAYAQSADPKAATAGKGMLLLVRWWKTAEDAAAQGKVVDDLEALAKANPDDAYLPQVAMAMTQQGAANKEIRQRIVNIVSRTMTSPVAKQVASQLEADAKLASLEGKPLVIQGVQLNGTNFSTADWKGKVILVDFWASWCAPCRAELPHVKSIYKQYHEKGLEILGVSCDYKEDVLKKFLADNPEMSWPELFDAAKPGWHALTTEYGIQGIPTMLLIDRKGVVRTVEARGKLDELIPKLLEEKE